jgi:uncharacterized protein with GYD domain
MPVGMMKLRTATPESLERFRDNPDELREFVKAVVEAAGAEFQNLYFDIGKERAYALIKDLDDYVVVKAVARILGAEGFIKMIETDDAVEAVAREREIRESLG